MDKSGKYDNIKIIVFSIATTILLSFGVLILQYSLGARKKEISTDELTGWISGKAANISFWATYSTTVLLLAIDIYRPNFFETYIALGIVLLITAGARWQGNITTGELAKKLAFNNGNMRMV